MRRARAVQLVPRPVQQGVFEAVSLCQSCADVVLPQTLLAYPLEALVPTSHQPGNAPRGHQKLSDKHEVQYFVTGQLAGRTLVVYMRRKGVSTLVSASWHNTDAKMSSSSTAFSDAWNPSPAVRRKSQGTDVHSATLICSTRRMIGSVSTRSVSTPANLRLAR